ncbi:MAG: thermonuclease family protein [Nitrospinota bacterium]|jgi:endonuclease YncB( thermonuclease family)|nr:thermonuclease family protein [Nitrospinota bacterium]
MRTTGKFLPVLAILALLSPATARGEKSFGSVRVEAVTSVYDGDSFRVNISGWPPIIGRRIPIRVAGVDTPEMKGRCPREKELARQAKRFVVAALRGAKVIELRNLRRGKYFRIVADVILDGESLAPMLIAKGLGVPYNGGRKTRPWC